MSFIPLLQAAQSGSLFMPIITFGLVFVIFYFFIIRPQNKKQKNNEKMIAGVKKGDKIITIGGIHGVVTSTKDQSVIVKVDDNCKIEFSRSSIGSVVVDKVEKTSDKPDSVSEKAEKGKKSDKNALPSENVSESSEQTSAEDKETK